MGGLFGSAPKATFSTQPTIQPGQQDILSQLVQALGSGGVQPQSGTFAAPVTPQQNSVLNALLPLINTPSQVPIQQGGQAVTQGLADTAQGSATVGQGVQTAVTGTGPINAGVTALQGLQPTLQSAYNYQAPQINAQQAFEQGVVQPLTTNFNENVLPGIQGQFGASAGGAFSSDAAKARQNAGRQLDQTLAQTGAQYSLSAAQANQQANIASQQAILNALGIGTQGAATSGNLGLDLTQVGSTLGSLGGQQANIGATGANIGATGATLPGTAQSANINPLLQILQALGLPQQTAQQQISGSYGTGQQYLADLIAAFTPQTQQTSAVGTGGQTGIIPGLLSALGPAGGALIGPGGYFGPGA